MKASFTGKITLFFSICWVAGITGHPTYLGQRDPAHARMSRSVMYSTVKKPNARKQALLVGLVRKLNHKK